MLRGVVKSIFEPGVNSHLWIALNVAFLCLVVVTCAMFVIVGFNIHLVVLLALSVGLLLSVNWFIIELQNVKQESADSKED